MFSTETEMRHVLEALPERQYYEITYMIEERRTGRRAAVTLAGRSDDLLRQMHIVYQDGWAMDLTEHKLLNFTRRNTERRVALGANRTQFGY